MKYQELQLSYRSMIQVRLQELKLRVLAFQHLPRAPREQQLLVGRSTNRSGDRSEYSDHQLQCRVGVYGYKAVNLKQQ